MCHHTGLSRYGGFGIPKYVCLRDGDDPRRVADAAAAGGVVNDSWPTAKRIGACRTQTKEADDPRLGLLARSRLVASVMERAVGRPCQLVVRGQAASTSRVASANDMPLRLAVWVKLIAA